MQLVPQPQHQHRGAFGDGVGADHRGASRQLHHQGMGAAEQLAALPGRRAETEPKLAAQIMVAQTLVQGLAVVFQPGEIELPAACCAPLPAVPRLA